METQAPIVGEHGRSSSPPCMNNSTNQVPHYGGWPLAIPSWEKEFCFEVGSYTWNNFLEAKAKSSMSSAAEKVNGWDDSGVEDAFNDAKKRFFAKKCGYDVPVDPLMNSIGYNNNPIEWDEDEYFDCSDEEEDEYSGNSTVQVVEDLYKNLIECDDEDDDCCDEEEVYRGMHTVWTVLQALQIGF